MELLSGKPVTEDIEKWCMDRVNILSRNKNGIPFLQVIQYGDDHASKSYVKRIKNNCNKIGIGFDYKIIEDDTV
ncbi:MAG: tetrahydrofolate dehydrogenase/cyclohydrolase catalytic domain-containing protein [Halanaerobiales bacterium]